MECECTLNMTDCLIGVLTPPFFIVRTVTKKGWRRTCICTVSYYISPRVNAYFNKHIGKRSLYFILIINFFKITVTTLSLSKWLCALRPCRDTTEFCRTNLVRTIQHTEYCKVRNLEWCFFKLFLFFQTIVICSNYFSN